MAQVQGVGKTSSSGQVSGKYYRTRSLSQNLQQIFHPNRQSHSRSINNLSAVGSNNNNMINKAQIGLNIQRNSIEEKSYVPQSLPQSPRIQIEPADPYYFIQNSDNQLHHSKSLNFSPYSMQHSNSTSSYPVYASSSSYAIPTLKSNVTSTKLKSYKLGETRRNHYTRSTSMEVPKLIHPLKKRPSWEERRSSNYNQELLSNDRYQINEVVKENSELLRKYSDPKIQGFNQESSLSLWQSTFKAKLASLFKNKKKYTIMEPSSGKETSINENYNNINRCDSAQSLPALVSQKKPKHSKKERSKNKLKKKPLEKYDGEGNLKALSLNPPQMIGGSFDNLLLINRLNKKRGAVGTYDTYHGRPLISHSSRLKSLYKYRKPSESDDATTLSFEYDSGDISDSSSLAQSSSDVGEISSSYSDLTTKSSNHAYLLRSSASVNSMPAIKVKHHDINANKRSKAVRSSNSSYNYQPKTKFPINFDAFNNNVSTSSSGTRISHTLHNTAASTIPRSNIPYQIPSSLYRNDYYSMTLPMMHQQYNSYTASIKPNLLASFATSSPPHVSNINNTYNAQMIKNFFTNGPGSSDEFPLVSYISFLDLSHTPYLLEKNKNS